MTASNKDSQWAHQELEQGLSLTKDLNWTNQKHAQGRALIHEATEHPGYYIQGTVVREVNWWTRRNIEDILAMQEPFYVLRNTWSTCNCGAKDNTLRLLVHHGTKYSGEPFLNANDHKPGETIPSYGRCSATLSPPADGRCAPLTPYAWMEANERHQIDGAPALTEKSKLCCIRGGVISILPFNEAQYAAKLRDMDNTEKQQKAEDKTYLQQLGQWIANNSLVKEGMQKVENVESSVGDFVKDKMGPGVYMAGQYVYNDVRDKVLKTASTVEGVASEVINIPAEAAIETCAHLSNTLGNTPIAAELLAHSTEPDWGGDLHYGKDMHFSPDSSVSQDLSSSEPLQNLIKEKAAGMKPGETMAISSSTTYDNDSVDRHLAYGSVNVAGMITCNSDHSLTFHGQVADLYDFNKKDWNSPANDLNNVARVAQQVGIIHPYVWKADVQFSCQAKTP